MREILFRGKRTDNDEWIKGYLHKTDGVGKGYRAFAIQVQDIDSYMCRPHSHEVQPKTVGQYTGLTDKNGKKIFEGDICRVIYIDRRCNSNGEHYDAENLIIEEVIFEKGTFCFKTTIEDIAMYRPIGFDIYEKQKIKCFEIIGNVFDNAELLNEN